MGTTSRVDRLMQSGGRLIRSACGLGACDANEGGRLDYIAGIDGAATWFSLDTSRNL